jgi:putative hydrolase of the HAD superfamily
MNYKHIFFDLDRTLWDFDQNMRLTLQEIFERHNLQSAFQDYDVFHRTFVGHNDRLWDWYRKGTMKKEVLRYKRFDLTLRDAGIKNEFLAQTIGEEYITESPRKTALIPHSIEVLDYLYKKYNLHIITNGFNEVQFTKIKLCGIDKYFQKVITSEMSGYHKPRTEAFMYLLSSLNAKKEEVLMIGDDLEIDIRGAKNTGMDQVYFNPEGTPHREEITYEIRCLLELNDFL